VGTLIKARDRFSDNQIVDLKASLERGGIVCMVTDTVYGLNCMPESGEALARLTHIKGSGARPFLLLIGELSWLGQLACEIPSSAQRLIARYWPGPLTLILKASDVVEPGVRGPRGTVAVRQPRSSLCEQLLLAMRRPLVSSSANVEGELPCTTGEGAARAFLDRVDVVVNSGRAPTKLPSTIVDVTLTPPTVVREGALRVDGDFLSQLNAR